MPSPKCIPCLRHLSPQSTSRPISAQSKYTVILPYVLDGSWYLPAQNRNADAEYLKEHIPGAIRFDVDAVSLKDTPLPHMLPTVKDFEKYVILSFRAVSEMGISNDDAIVVYDGLNIFSSARVFWTFHVFGHRNIAVLDGGFPAWKKAHGPISDAPPLIRPAKYKAVF